MRRTAVGWNWAQKITGVNEIDASGLSGADTMADEKSDEQSLKSPMKY